MKYDVTQTLSLFNGNDALMDAESGGKRAMTLRDAIVLSCLNAGPDIAKTGDQKHKLFLVLDKAHAAEKDVDLSSEEVSLVKRASGELFTVPLVGAIYKILEGAQG